MTLRMTGPTRNRLGIFQARLWVPTDLQPTLKKKEVVRSLGTRDPGAAKALFKTVAAEIEDGWAELRTAAQFVNVASASMPEPRAITQKVAHALAGEFYRQIIAQHQDNPGTFQAWETQLKSMQRLLPKHERLPGVYVIADDTGWTFHPARNAFYALCREVRAFLDKRSDNLDQRSLILLCSAVAQAKRDAFEQMLRNARGNYSPDPNAVRFPQPVAPEAVLSAKIAGSSAGSIGVEDVLIKWRTLGHPSSSSFLSYSGKLRMLMKFINKDDVGALTKHDVQLWRDHRIAIGISSRTVASGDLSGVRSILGWASAHTSVPQITENVALEVHQKVKNNRLKLRESGFTYDEAMKILSATFDPVSENYTPARAGARRWVPWLCAYSGARVGEISQMHSSRIIERSVPNANTYWCMQITPEDGSVKDYEARIIPLHSHLIDLGFIDYARRRQKLGKPLFYDPELGRGSTTRHQSVKVGDHIREWVRDELKITGVQPNHAWRHRFETISRSLEIREDIVDHITGHVGADVSAKYGDFLIEALSKAIEKMPRFEVRVPPAKHSD